MTKVAIVPVSTESGGVSYSAVSGDKQTSGKTAGEALDALTAKMNNEEASTLIIIQNQHPDRFFSTKQQRRLHQLMDRWRTARDKGDSLPEKEQAELEKLVEIELQASKDRAASLAEELNQ